jgi:glutamyl-tRNA reductase
VGGGLSGVRTNLEDLRVYAWETASLSPISLLALEAEIGSLLDWSEGIPIVTCQRYEVVALAGVHPEIAPHCYRGEAALIHLGRLASGLESLVLGEVEVLGQVRTAFSAAPVEMRRLIAPAIAAARALRAEQDFTQHAGHALDLALEYNTVELGGTLTVVGGGPMGRRVAERARTLGFDTTLVARRPPPLPPEIHYRPFSALADLPPTDILVACLGRSAPQMCPSDLPPVRRLAIDLGTPRNLKDDYPVPLVTLAALLASRHDGGIDSAMRRKLSARLEELLTSRLAMNVPDSPLGSLREEVERIRQRELTRSVRLHPDLPPEKLDTITRTLVNQIFHRPSRRLRQSGDLELATALADLFREAGQEAADGN